MARPKAVAQKAFALTQQGHHWGYILTYSCGCERELFPKFDSEEEAEFHARWSLSNTICDCWSGAEQMRQAVLARIREEREEVEEL